MLHLWIAQSKLCVHPVHCNVVLAVRSHTKSKAVLVSTTCSTEAVVCNSPFPNSHIVRADGWPLAGGAVLDADCARSKARTWRPLIPGLESACSRTCTRATFAHALTNARADQLGRDWEASRHCFGVRVGGAEARRHPTAGGRGRMYWRREWARQPATAGQTLA